MSNYVAARVVAVPVCRPARPARAHPSLNSSHTMRVFLVWKRRYADVRAGTQAPPLRLSLSKPQKNKFGTCRGFGKRQKKISGLADGSANAKKRFWDLPMVRQTQKKDFETCRRFGKRQKKIWRLAGSSANDKKII